MDITKSFGFLIAVLVGIGVGYYIGHSRGIAQGIEQERAVSAVANLKAQTATSPNPLQNVKTNPYKDIKTNPFQ